MMNQDNLAVYFVEMLAKQDVTAEEKKIQALIKAAVYGVHLDTFIDEVTKAFEKRPIALFKVKCGCLGHGHI